MVVRVLADRTIGGSMDCQFQGHTTSALENKFLMDLNEIPL